MKCPECGGNIPIPGKLTAKQKAALENWNAVVGYPFMHLDEVKAGEMSFRDAWNSNLEWLGSVYASAQNFYHGEGDQCICDEEKVN